MEEESPMDVPSTSESPLERKDSKDKIEREAHSPEFGMECVFVSDMPQIGIVKNGDEDRKVDSEELEEKCDPIESVDIEKDLFDESPIKRVAPLHTHNYDNLEQSDPECEASTSSSPKRPVVKRIKLDPEFEPEADESKTNSASASSHSASPTPPPSPRIRQKRVCVEKQQKSKETTCQEEKDKADADREGSCERSDCTIQKSCCLNLVEGCIVTRVDPEGKYFHHISKTEHVCGVCYDTIWKYGKEPSKYSGWKAIWTNESRCNPSVKAFILDQLLPYWLECSKCKKYRKFASDGTINPDQIRNFTCGICDEAEDPIVQQAKEWKWILTIAASPLLQNSCSLFYLKGGHYFYDELGISPVESRCEEKECLSKTFMSPFNIPEQQSKAFCLRPDVMDYDEVRAFPEYSNEGVLFLALRNLIVTLWNLNPLRYLTLESCIPEIITRGMARIWYIEELARVHEFLRVKSIINYGILDIPKSISKRKQNPLDVIVIGAGISGLSAARQLRSFGATVKILESKGHIGGRMEDDWSLGVAVGCGAQLVTGSINNPIILMCEQTGTKYRIVEGPCPLIDGAKGGVVDAKVDRYVEEHFDCVLDTLYHWKRSENNGDASLEETGWFNVPIGGETEIQTIPF